MSYKGIFGRRLKKLREKNNITQKGLSRSLGVSQQAITWWESGRRFPNGKSLIEIADYFNTSIDYMVGRLDK